MSGKILSDAEVQELIERRGVLHLGAGPVTFLDGPEPRQRAEFSRVRGLKASAPGAREQARRPAAGSPAPRSLAAAIKIEVEAGNTKNPAAMAAAKFPELAAAWLAELQNCASSELAL